MLENNKDFILGITYYTLLIGVVATIFYASCNKSTKENQQDVLLDSLKKEELKKEKLKRYNDAYKIKLYQKYNAVLFDTLSMFSFQIEEYLIDKKNKLFIEGYIDDLIKIDTIYYLKLNSDKKNPYLDDYKYYEYNNFYLTLNKNQTGEIQSNLLGNKNKNGGGFIITVDSIKNELHNSILEIPNRIFI